jgi:type 2 lantibiotic biosynthesis protein LanM
VHADDGDLHRLPCVTDLHHAETLTRGAVTEARRDWVEGRHTPPLGVAAKHLGTDTFVEHEGQPATPRPDAGATAEPLEYEAAIRLIEEPIVPEVIAPVRDAAERELRRLADERDWNVAPDAVRDMVGEFGRVLARVTNLVILQRFTGFQLVARPLWRPLAAPPGDAPDGAPRDVLDSYIAWERIERLVADDGPYPELSRLLAVARENWLGATSELMERIERHRDAIARIASSGASLGPLTSARFGISDPHGGGRAAAILSFEGRDVVYKPRSLDGEIGWTATAAQVLQEGLGLEAYPLRLAGFDGYGFMEHVGPQQCMDGAAVERCYRRYGALLALAHALGTCDLHHENVIVSGEHPLVVDAEPLFRARLAISSEGAARLAFERNLVLEGLDVRESVLELGMLPLTMKPPLPIDAEHTPREYDVGALCAYAGDEIHDLVPCARGSNDLQMRFVPLVANRFPNLPMLNGKPQFPSDFVEEIIAGFSTTHRFLRAHRGEYLRPGGQLDDLATSRVRLLGRATMDYATVLARSLSPEPLRSSAARSNLVRSDLRHLGAVRFDTVHDLAAEETASIRDGDIPRFELRADETNAGRAPLLTAPLESARARWAALDDFDEELQVTSIRQRLYARERPLTASRPSASDRASLERHALAIVSELVAAVRSPAADPYWVYAAFAPGFGATMAHADREALYEGAAGTAVVVAEAGRVAEEPDWCRLATKVFDRSGGLARGVGGLIYAMTRVADAGGDRSLLDTAVRIALDHGPRLAAEDALDELLYGRAGLLLALLALHDRRPDVRLRSVADLAARELLARARQTDRGTCWPVPAGSPMPNVSHGTAGIAMALARWARLRGSAEAAETAEDALAYDDTFWIPDERGWLDARLADADHKHHTNWAWCNGRAGALLARAAVADALGRRFQGANIASALEADASDILTEVSPGLCCGTPGALDALLQVQTQAPGEALTARVAAVVDLVVAETPKSHYSTLTSTLFGGAAGLAFGLLRAARPTDVAGLLWFG